MTTSPDIAHHLRLREERLKAQQRANKGSIGAHEEDYFDSGSHFGNSSAAEMVDTSVTTMHEVDRKHQSKMEPLTPSSHVVSPSDREIDRLWKERTYLRQRCRRLEGEVDGLRSQLSRYKKGTPASTVEDMLYEEIESQRNELHKQKDIIEKLQADLKERPASFISSPVKQQQVQPELLERIANLEDELNQANSSNKSLKLAIKAMQDGHRNIQSTLEHPREAEGSPCDTSDAFHSMEEAQKLALIEIEKEKDVEKEMSYSSHLLTLSGLVGWARQEVNYRIPNHGKIHEALRDVHEGLQELSCGSGEFEKRRIAGGDELDQKWQEQLLLKPPTPSSFSPSNVRKPGFSGFEHARVVRQPVNPVPELDTSAHVGQSWQTYEVGNSPERALGNARPFSNRMRSTSDAANGVASHNGEVPTTARPHSTRSEQMHSMRSSVARYDGNKPTSTRSAGRLPVHGHDLAATQLANDAHAWKLLAEQFNINVPRTRKMGHRR